MTASISELVKLKNYLAALNEDLKELMAREGCTVPVTEAGHWDLPNKIWILIDDMKRIAKEYREKRGCPAVTYKNTEYPYVVKMILEAKEI
jgi:hypothetical protein